MTHLATKLLAGTLTALLSFSAAIADTLNDWRPVATDMPWHAVINVPVDSEAYQPLGAFYPRWTQYQPRPGADWQNDFVAIMQANGQRGQDGALCTLATCQDLFIQVNELAGVRFCDGAAKNACLDQAYWFPTSFGTNAVVAESVTETDSTPRLGAALAALEKLHGQRIADLDEAVSGLAKQVSDETAINLQQDHALKALQAERTQLRQTVASINGNVGQLQARLTAIEQPQLVELSPPPFAPQLTYLGELLGALPQLNQWYLQNEYWMSGQGDWTINGIVALVLVLLVAGIVRVCKLLLGTTSSQRLTQLESVAATEKVRLDETQAIAQEAAEAAHAVESIVYADYVWATQNPSTEQLAQISSEYGAVWQCEHKGNQYRIKFWFEAGDDRSKIRTNLMRNVLSGQLRDPIAYDNDRTLKRKIIKAINAGLLEPVSAPVALVTDGGQPVAAAA